MTIQSTEIIKFSNDPEYLDWVNSHSEGYILTSNRSLTPHHTVIHHITCNKIRELTGNAKPGGFTNNYIKVYALRIATLQAWVVGQRVDAKFRECTRCAGKN
jgi:hypothetical protein